MNYEQTSLVRQLIPKAFSFDAYNSINCPNFREKIFFSDNVIPMETHYLKTKIVSDTLLKLEFSSVCPKSEIQIMLYYLTLNKYISKLKIASKENCDFISLSIKIQNCCNRPVRHHRCRLETKDCINLRKSRTKISKARIYFDMSEVEKALEILEK